MEIIGALIFIFLVIITILWSPDSLIFASGIIMGFGLKNHSLAQVVIALLAFLLSKALKD